MRRPDVFIIGAPKAGTTSLYEYLRGHPQVFMSPVKEPAYFSPDVPPRKLKFRHAVDEKRYLELFSSAGEARRAGEASTYYLFSRRAPGLIHEFQPDARIIVMLRNPIDLMHSLHAHRHSSELDEIADFEQALAADLDPPGYGGPIRRATIQRAATLRERARFGAQLPLWYETFGPERIHPILFEEFRSDSPGVYRQVLEFLEVDPTFLPETFAIHNPRHMRRRGVAFRLLHNPFNAALVHRVLPVLIGRERAARTSRRIRQSPINRTSAERQPIDDALRRRLEEEFVADVQAASQLVDRDLAGVWFGRQAEATAPQAMARAG